MILRPLQTSLASSAVIEPAWVAIERSQRQDYSAGCWLVPQPAHAALSGEIAAQLDAKAFPGITSEVVRAIALHDAGWSPDDAAIIQESRARGMKAKPYSFIAAPPKDTLAAWTGSIEIAGKSSPLGGYLVSRHFAAIGETFRAKVDAKTVKLLESFTAAERARQAKLRKKLTQTDSDLDHLLSALQFSDLLSLYISSGCEGNVEFAQTVGGKAMQLQRQGDGIRITPSPFAGEVTLTVAAIRHPRTNEESSRLFAVVCEA